jgi:hypothetical protein
MAEISAPEELKALDSQLSPCKSQIQSLQKPEVLQTQSITSPITMAVLDVLFLLAQLNTASGTCTKPLIWKMYSFSPFSEKRNRND